MDFSNIYIKTFIQSIPNHQDRLKDAFDEGLGEPQLVNFVQFCCESVDNICDEAFESLMGKTVGQFQRGETYKKLNPDKAIAQELEEHFITYDWVEVAKSFTLLIRDILVQHQKSALLVSEGETHENEAETTEPNDEVERLKAKSLDVIAVAYSFFEGYFERSMSDLVKNESKSLEKFKLQENPWPIYKEQFALINQQAVDLKKTGERLKGISNTFRQMRHLILNTPVNCNKEFEQFVEKAKYAKEFVDKNMLEKSGKVATYLEELENEVKLPPHLDGFLSTLKEYYEKLGGKIQVPIGIQEGIIQTKEIDFKRKVRQWIDAEILPLLYELWEHTEAVEGNLKMSLINIRNRAIILSTEASPGADPKEVFGQPLELYLAKVKDWEHKMSTLDVEIKERMEANLHMAQVYQPNKEFLPISMQSTFTNLDLGQNEVFSFFKNQYNRLRSFISRIQKDVEKEGTLSQSEKIVRAIEGLSIKDPDNAYTSIFQTKGYIGESFWVGRQEPLQHFSGIIQMWEKGFRGGVLLTGHRLSGKTLFGEKVSNQHFPKDTIRIMPNSVVKVKGKKMLTEYNLETVLDFVRNNTINSKALIWIDDLELWANQNFSLGQNVRSLKDFMDNYSGQLFFLVSMSNWVKWHLNNLYNIESSFQAEINLDKMEREEVIKAIMIRHGATHKILVNEEQEELTVPEFRTKVNKAYKAANGVIGDALNRWVIGTNLHDVDQVTYESPTIYKLPDFINPDMAVLLHAIYLQKITTDYRLRKMFGTPYTNKYKSLLRRLISLKIVIRNIDGTIEINECIANELARNLNQKNYLQF